MGNATPTVGRDRQPVAQEHTPSPETGAFLWVP
jgi:hypothetical protein